jgi:hypothetical protein
MSVLAPGSLRQWSNVRPDDATPERIPHAQHRGLESTSLVVAGQAGHDLAPQPAPACGYRFRPVSGGLTNLVELSTALTMFEKLSVRLTWLGKEYVVLAVTAGKGGGGRSSNAHLRPF